MKNLFLFLITLLLAFSCNKSHHKIESISEKDNDSSFSKAVSFMEEGKYDSAFLYFDLSCDIRIALKDSLRAAYCYMQMARILYYAEDFNSSQENSLLALDYLDSLKSSDIDYLGSNYNLLANTVAALDNLEESIHYYDLAIKYSSDSTLKSVYKNNKAVTLFDAGKLEEGLAIYENLLFFQPYNENIEYARILSNYANVKWRIRKNYNPRNDFYRALNIRTKLKDLRGENASYSHLFSYYETIDKDSAFYYAQRSYQSALELKSNSDILKGLEQLMKSAPVYAVRGHFSMYKNLSDSIVVSQVKSKNKYALIRYDTEKSKVENLKLKQEVVRKETSVTIQRLILLGLIFIIIFISFGTVFWYNKRKERLKFEAQSRIKENQLKTSQKVHDVVANGIYRIMTEIEYKDEMDREDILDRLEVIYEKSRDLSYEVNNSVFRSFKEDLTELFRSFSTVEVKVLVVGNEEQLWTNFSKNKQEELLLVFQELLVNSEKHSMATEIIIRFEQKNNSIICYFKDNGIGLPQNFKIGNGIKNTENRIERIGGMIRFVSEQSNGTTINITLANS